MARSAARKPPSRVLVSFAAALLAAAFAFSCAIPPQPSYAQGGNDVAGFEVAVSATAENAAVNLKRTAVKKVRLSKRKILIRNNGTFKLSAKLVGRGSAKKLTGKKVKWSISNPKIARISQQGVVQGKTSGTALVTAKAGNAVKATARVRVVVNKAEMATAIPVLTYHRISADYARPLYTQLTHLIVTKTDFDAQMRWLKRNGYTTVSTSEFKDWRVDGAFLPKKSVLITIDDGFYETYHVAYPVLRKYNFKATSFVIGSTVTETTDAYNPYDTTNHYLGWDAINKVRKVYPNLEFQSHTYGMHKRDASGYGVVGSWSKEEIDADFEKARKFGFTAIAYPFGHTSANLLASVSENKSIKIGFGYPMNHAATRTSARYNIPRIRVESNDYVANFVQAASLAR